MEFNNTEKKLVFAGKIRKNNTVFVVPIPKDVMDKNPEFTNQYVKITLELIK